MYNHSGQWFKNKRIPGFLNPVKDRDVAYVLAAVAKWYHPG